MDARLAAAIRWAEAASGPALAVLLIQLTVVAALGLGALVTLRRASAAVRHLVGVVTLAALVALPLASAWMPRVRLPLLPASATPVVVAVTPPPAEAPRPTLVTLGVEDEARWFQASPAPRTSAPPSGPVAPYRLPFEWPAAVLLLAIAVSAALLVRGMIGAALVSWVCSRARTVDDPRIRAAFDDARARLGVRTPVRLATSERVGVPAVAGLLRPTLVLPPSAASWDAAQLRIVFLHELAHVVRSDAVGLLLGRVATALYWFHPLAWLVAREVRRDAERACDDVVLGCGERASEYARHLLHIAAEAGARDPLAGLTLAAARRSSLEGRLVAILRGDLPRGAVSRRATAGCAIAAALALLGFASVRVVAATADEATPPAPPVAAAEPVEPTSVTTEVRPVTLTRADTRTDTRTAMRTVTTTVASNGGEGDGEGEGDSSPNTKRSGERAYGEAQRLYQMERYTQAAEAYRRAAQGGYRKATALYNAACSFALAGDKPHALEALDQAIDAGFDDRHLIESDSDLDPIRDESRFAAIVRKASPEMVEQRNRSATLAEYDRLRGVNDDDPGVWSSIGIRLMRTGSYPQAADAFQRQQRLAPGSTAPLYNTACAWALGNDRTKAFAALDQAIAAGYGDAEHMMGDEDLRSLHGDARFDRAVRLTRDLEIRHGGRDDDDTAAWRDELPRYERVARENGSMGRAWSNLGYARLRAGDASGSYTAYQRALDLGYRKGTTSYNLACAAAQLGRKDEAIQWLERARDAGMSIGPSAYLDHDLRPLRSDHRFWDLIDRSVETEVGKQLHLEKAKTSDKTQK